MRKVFVSILLTGIILLSGCSQLFGADNDASIYVDGEKFSFGWTLAQAEENGWEGAYEDSEINSGESAMLTIEKEGKLIRVTAYNESDSSKLISSCSTSSIYINTEESIEIDPVKGLKIGLSKAEVDGIFADADKDSADGWDIYKVEGIDLDFSVKYDDDIVSAIQVSKP